jgi:hypothetical protein
MRALIAGTHFQGYGCKVARIQSTAVHALYPICMCTDQSGFHRIGWRHGEEPEWPAGRRDRLYSRDLSTVPSYTDGQYTRAKVDCGFAGFGDLHAENQRKQGVFPMVGPLDVTNPLEWCFDQGEPHYRDHECRRESARLASRVWRPPKAGGQAPENG